ncbi:MAG TPA: DUF4136 domain-containing protein [Ramlibacter sp.]|uniref:DUF4136 domain-containing protein n=1 Tax=Ramlibacter sp. TaxID=1917967 RepID=UPI002CC2E2EF|nr:DUF4136 domain-containing protein [Ramlibacter sp.]HVZ43964.1 DUF4136 domain-containing protein [Ramlibacter sp.]
MRPITRLACAGLMATAGLLAGCATGYKLDNQVQSFSSLPAAASQLSYRFDRTPSQQADPNQAQLEAFADQALFQAGFRRNDAAPRFAVQVTARVQPMLSPYADPWDRFGWGFGGWGWGRHGGLGIGFGTRLGDSPWYHREVNVIVRELASNKVVYETRAVNDGPWLDNTSVLPAMFHAALQGFPNPPQGVRRVDIQVGGEKKAAAS